MTAQNHFTKYAKLYDNNNIIQRIVSKALVREVNFKAKNILELGCGSGQIYRQINWEIDNYTAVDFSSTMCNLHPKGDNIEVKCYDFDSYEFFDYINNKKFDLVLSSAALQWSSNINKLLNVISKITNNFHCVLFTSNTFKSIYEITKQEAKILCIEDIKKAFSIYDFEFEIFNYNLEFQNKKEMYQYIKNSGVQGDGSLSFKQAKNLYMKYDLNYLEFEVVFIKSKFK